MSGPSRRALATAGRAALLIAVLTVAARIAGFGRNLVFSHTVGQTCLGQTYQTANMIPNIVFEVVAGGALASVVVPLISRHLAGSRRADADQTASALLTWAVALLVPAAVLIAVLARPLAALLLGDGGCDGAVDAAATMLRIFAPQVVLYGVGIVLTGVLQAHRRFGGPALAPLLSSAVVIGAYLLFAVAAGAGADLPTVSSGHQAILSVGTTLGVVALSLSLLVPLHRTGVRLRPTFRFPGDSGRRARAMALSGMAGLLAQQAFVAITLILANQDQVPAGAINVFVYAQTIYLLPWAVLAVPIATAAFPSMSQAAAAEDDDRLSTLLDRSYTSILALGAVATAAIVAAAREISIVFVGAAPGTPSVAMMTAAVIGFSVGLVGYGAYALHSRALYAQSRPRAAALVTVGGWAVAIVTAIVLSVMLPPAERVAALAWGNGTGALVLGVAATAAVAAGRFPTVRWLAQLVGASAAAAAIGWAVHLIPLDGIVSVGDADVGPALLVGTGRGMLAALLALAFVLLSGGSGLRSAIRTRLGSRRSGAELEESS